jgi:hypothetical protein
MELYNQFDDILTITKSEDSRDLYYLTKSNKYLDGKVVDTMCLCLSKKDILIIAGKLLSEVDSTEAEVLETIINSRIDEIIEKLQHLKMVNTYEKL